MSKYIGWLAVSPRTGFMLEGKDHAAKIFDTQAVARRAVRPLQDHVPVPVTYRDLVASLLKGSAFCFDNDDGYTKFVKCLRYDLAHKVFLVYSQDRAFVHWRHKNEKDVAKTDPGAGVAPDPAVKAPPSTNPPVEAQAFNPDILVRRSDG